MLVKIKFKIGLLVFWTIFIFILMIMPLPENVATAAPDNTDKAVHFLLFGIFAYLLASVLLTSRKRLKLAMVNSFIFSLLYSLGCEIIQNFIPYRSMSILDFLAGAGGIAVALLIFYVCQPTKQ
ncbi:MAG: VanZ family protein [Candidatus Falkowbacteria bacterium]|nr:VanZ family protein [Candidatus Falkowbacteria bacterium]